MDNQKHIPLYQALLKHAAQKPISFHVPGHKNGKVLPEQAKDQFQQLLQLDVTELSGLDDLHAPEGVIKEAEDLLAGLYQVQKSFLLVNGSTVGNLAMILAAVKEDEMVLVQRNCHKSVLNALKLAKARPVFLEPEFDREWGVSTGVSLETLKEAVYRFPEVKAIILTYPNYYGMVYDLEALISHAHLHNIPVLVDEAHGPHFILGSPFPASAVELGADIVVQSAHKTLPALTMGSFLHINSSRIKPSKVKEFLQIFQSSSPSYPIMASLDLARSYLAEYNQKDVRYLIEQINGFKEQLNEIQSIKVLSCSDGDLLKVTIQSRCHLSGFDLQQQLEKEGIYTELADPENILFVIPLLKDNQHFPLNEALKKIKSALGGIPANPKKQEYQLSPDTITELAIGYKQMLSCENEIVPLLESAGRVSAETVIPYPPGIPLLLTGERVTKQKLRQLIRLLESGARFQGGEALDHRLIRIFKTE